MNEKQIKELRAHAGKLVAEGKPLSGVFEWFDIPPCQWVLFPNGERLVPNFEDGSEWRIAQPKKQTIKWEHPYFKGCATNCGELLRQGELIQICESTLPYSNPVTKSDLRLSTPANDDSNWQYFRSSPENDAKLRELAKMVKVEVRFCDTLGRYFYIPFSRYDRGMFEEISNYRITGECQDGWTDKPEEAV